MMRRFAYFIVHSAWPAFKLWFRNVAIAIDQTVNALFGGDPDETISSKCGKRISTCVFCRWLCRALGKLDKRHCASSIEADEGKDDLTAINTKG